MDTIIVRGRLTSEEKETILTYDYETDMWHMDSTIAKHFNKALKQKWMPIRQYIYEDGTVCGMVLEASAKGVTIRNPEIKRVMSEEQMKNLHRKKDIEEE